MTQYMARSADNLLAYDTANDAEAEDPLATSEHPSKKRGILGLTIPTPNTSRFSMNIHSRILQKFPFLMEMFYWVITFLLYRMARVASQVILSKSRIWDVSQEHGLRILELEQFGPVSFLFPVREHGVQQWFIQGHQRALAITYPWDCGLYRLVLLRGPESFHICNTAADSLL